MVALGVTLLVLLQFADSQSTSTKRIRSRKVVLSSGAKVIGRRVPVFFPKRIQGLDTFSSGNPRKTPCKTTVIFARPGSLRSLPRNVMSAGGRRLRKVKVIKKFMRRRPLERKVPVHRFSRPERGHRGNQNSGSSPIWVIKDSSAPSERTLFFKAKPRALPKSLKVVFVSGAHTPNFDRSRGLSHMMNDDVTIMHKRRKYTLSTSSKARLRGYPGLAIHIKKLS